MNITVNKDGAVSFTQMNPTAAALLLDLATDLAAGRLALCYADGQTVEPTPRARQALASIPARYERHDTPPVGSDAPWGELWSSQAPSVT